VRIDGRIFATITQASLRAAVGNGAAGHGVVQPIRIATTFAYARPDASQSEIEQAARGCTDPDFIASLPARLLNKMVANVIEALRRGEASALSDLRGPC